MDHEAVTRAELYTTAKALGLSVTSRTKKKALIRLLAESAGTPADTDGTAESEDSGTELTDPGGRVSASHDDGTDSEDASGQAPTASRQASFRSLAAARAAGEMVSLPRTLVGNDRRIHVRQTIREDHRTRIARHDEEAFEKFDKLAGSRFSFFRGTALLFYRDMAGEDPWMPTVLAAGDVHPENFGVMPNADNVPIFGINDYDEVFYGPFTWDLKRGATGFMIAADEIGGYGRGKRRKIAASFVRGYADKISTYAADHTEDLSDLRRDSAPELVVDLIDDATAGGRAKWLAKKYFDETKQGFKSSKKLVPISSRRRGVSAADRPLRRGVEDLSS